MHSFKDGGGGSSGSHQRTNTAQGFNSQAQDQAGESQNCWVASETVLFGSSPSCLIQQQHVKVNQTQTAPVSSGKFPVYPITQKQMHKQGNSSICYVGSNEQIGKGDQALRTEGEQIQDTHKASSVKYIERSSIFNTHESYVIITKPEEVTEISQAILRSRPDPILGVDCEGLAKGRPLSLLQMYFAGKCYLFDLLAVNPFKYGLKEVMVSKTIMKIFHDFCEDQSALINQYNLYCEFVFDTQIAHRVIQQALNKTPKLTNFKDNNISLADLLKNYIDVTHTKKHEISLIMKNDDEFWESRPLTQDMIDYATQDVLYLPHVYQKMQKEYGLLKLIHQFYQHGHQYFEEITIFNKIMRDTSLCYKYAFINRHIHHIDQLQPQTVIQAFIKNYQEYGVYCSLNVGVSGIVLEDYSVKQLRQYFDIGDIIQVQVEGFRKSGHVILKFLGPQNPNYSIPQSVQHCSQYPNQYDNRQFVQKTPYDNYSASSRNSFQSNGSLPSNSPLYFYQQNSQFFKNQAKKSLNIQSPEFIPDTSVNSSNGDITVTNENGSENNWPVLNVMGGQSTDLESSFTAGQSNRHMPSQGKLSKHSSEKKQYSQMQQQSSLYYEEIKQSNSFINQSPSPQKYFNQIKTAQGMYIPTDNQFKPMRLASDDDNSTKQQYQLAQGSQGGQLKQLSRNTPQKLNSSIGGINQPSGIDDMEEVKNILNETLAKLNKGQIQMKFVVTSNNNQLPQQLPKTQQNFQQSSRHLQ